MYARINLYASRLLATSNLKRKFLMSRKQSVEDRTEIPAESGGSPEKQDKATKDAGGKRKPGRPRANRMVKTSMYLREDLYEKLQERAHSAKDPVSMGTQVNKLLAIGLEGRQVTPGDLVASLPPKLRDMLVRIREVYGVDELSSVNLVLARHLTDLESELETKYGEFGDAASND